MEVVQLQADCTVDEVFGIAFEEFVNGSGLIASGLVFRNSEAFHPGPQEKRVEEHEGADHENQGQSRQGFINEKRGQDN